MSARQDPRLARVLDREGPAGGWFLHGDAIRLRDEAARQLVDAALDPATRDFNYDQFHGEDVTGEQLASTLAMPPMMAERRVVWLRDVERLPTRARDVLKRAAAKLPPDIALIVTATIPKGSRAAFYRDLKKSCRTLEWSTPRAAEIPGWIRDRARARWRFDLSPAAAQLIAGAVGSDLSTLDAELEKLSQLPADRRTEAEISALIPRTHRIDRWSWLDLVASRNYGRALRELEDVLTSERGVGLVAGLVEHHLLLGLALDTGTAGLRAVLSETGRGYLSWKAGTYARQARGWTVDELDRALRALHRADRQLKSGRGDPPVLADLLLSLGQMRSVSA
ncbi:DNA polymerase III subunit delta [Candidatus Palauibacter sp.]|uniref:DNA polymerase III subunit delta n=1 Tax=Candidatus Palauibacter sp. TaxID=3101350 RepID=UPI003C6F510E